MSFFDENFYLPDDLLYKTDIATMAYSLEGRTPFLDQKVAAYAKNISYEEKYKGRVGKRPLRDLLEKRLPKELVMRGKSGFSIPAPLLNPLVLRDIPEALQKLTDYRVPGISQGFLEKLSRDTVFRTRAFSKMPALPFMLVMFGKVMAQYDIAHD